MSNITDLLFFLSRECNQSLWEVNNATLPPKLSKVPKVPGNCSYGNALTSFTMILKMCEHWQIQHS